MRYSQADEGTLGTNMNTSRVRSPDCAGGCVAATAVVPVPLSAADESAARKGNARECPAIGSLEYSQGPPSRVIVHTLE
jgi:hypothetical protein